MIVLEEGIAIKFKDKIKMFNNIQDKTIRLATVKIVNKVNNKLNSWIFKKYTKIFIINHL